MCVDCCDDRCVVHLQITVGATLSQWREQCRQARRHVLSVQREAGQMLLPRALAAHMDSALVEVLVPLLKFMFLAARHVSRAAELELGTFYTVLYPYSANTNLVFCLLFAIYSYAVLAIVCVVDNKTIPDASMKKLLLAAMEEAFQSKFNESLEKVKCALAYISLYTPYQS